MACSLHVLGTKAAITAAADDQRVLLYLFRPRALLQGIKQRKAALGSAPGRSNGTLPPSSKGTSRCRPSPSTG